MNHNSKLVKLRTDRGLTISQAAEGIGISYGLLAMLETRKRKGSDETKIKISQFYGVPVGELFFFTEKGDLLSEKRDIEEQILELQRKLRQVDHKIHLIQTRGDRA